MCSRRGYYKLAPAVVCRHCYSPPIRAKRDMNSNDNDNIVLIIHDGVVYFLAK